jgi:CRISPR-associated protein Cmr1
MNCPNEKPKSNGTMAGFFLAEYDIRVITPMFGGGIEARKNDPITLIRVPSIRGQLRFWWRATRGAQLNLKQLKEQEEVIWGSTKLPSKVTLQVVLLEEGKSAPCAFFPPDKSNQKLYPGYPSYALFPFLQGKKGESEPDISVVDILFKLVINYPKEYAQDVLAAIWAWVNFGGLGARTRRGCGSLYCAAFSPNLKDVANNQSFGSWYVNKLQEYSISLTGLKPGIEWAMLPTADGIKFLVAPAEPKDAWQTVIRVLQDFRQGNNIGRNQGQQNRPGRSRWPEPDSLRRISGRAFHMHKNSITGNRNGFPRAELGLPMIFHFKDKQDPGDSTIQPVGKERMASPLILKPLACQENGKVKALSMICRLQTPDINQVELKTKDNGNNQRFPVRQQAFNLIANSPLNQKGKQYQSALDAFMAFARERGYK